MSKSKIPKDVDEYIAQLQKRPVRSSPSSEK